DVTLDQNAMILQRLRIETAPEITEVREAVVSKPEELRPCLFNFIGRYGIRFRCANRLRRCSQHPRYGLVGHASDGEHQSKLWRRLDAARAQDLDLVERIERQLCVSCRKTIRFKNV